MKRKYVSGCAAASDADDGTEESMHTDNEDDSANVEASSNDSDVLQHTEFQVRIIFADGGWIAKSIAKTLVKDERESLETADLLETAEVLNCSMIIGSNFPDDEPPSNSHIRSRLCETKGEHATSWHVWYDDDQWTVAEFSTVPMSPDHPCLRGRECAIMHLCHHRGFELTVMFVKVLRGIAAADDTLQLNYSEREAVVNAAFSFLAEPQGCPVIVASDLGVGFSTVHEYISSNKDRATVQTHCIHEGSFHTFFRSAKPWYRCISINIDNPRMFAYQVEVHSGDQHPTAKVIHRSKRLALTPRCQVQ